MKSILRFPILFSLLGVMVLFSCEEQTDPLVDDQIPTAQPNRESVNITTIDPGDELCRSRDLIAGQNYVVGKVNVYKVGGTDNYKVQYELNEGCSLSEFHIAAGREDQIPKNGGGCPQIGHFPYQMEGLDTNSIAIDIGRQNEWFVVAAHAVVKCDGSPFNGEQTAWAGGKRFPDCNSWALCFSVQCGVIPI
jgi:hypothetical protein